MKTQIGRLHEVLENLQYRSRQKASRYGRGELEQVPHTILRGWLITVQRKMESRNKTITLEQLAVEEIDRPGGGSTIYAIENISPDCRFLFQVRVLPEIAREFRRKLNITTAELPWEGIARSQVFWIAKNKPYDIAMDLYEELRKYKFAEKDSLAPTNDLGVITARLDRMRRSSPRKAPRLHELTDTIYAMFQKNNMKAIEAVDFEVLDQYASRPTVIKAKRIMGIKSAKKGGKWYWLAPEYPPDKAIEGEHRKRVKESEREFMHGIKVKVSRPAVTALHDVMASLNYEARAPVVIRKFRERGYSTNTAKLVKKIAKISSVKLSDGWHWIYPAPVVKEWLIHRLAEGPVQVTELTGDAHERGWSLFLLKAAKKAIGGIEYCVVDKHAAWRDINDHRVVETEEIVETQYVEEQEPESESEFKALEDLPEEHVADDLMNFEIDVDVQQFEEEK